MAVSMATFISLLLPGLRDVVAKSPSDGCGYGLEECFHSSSILITGSHPNGWQVKQTILVLKEIEDETYKVLFLPRAMRFVQCFPRAALAEARVR